ncbi:MAG: hypothetical protein QOC70_196 [Verrucomicrobiota bacterium]
MKPLSATATEKISRFFKHPLFITLFSTLVASWVIPGIVGRSNIEAARAKARIDQALEVMNASNSVNTHLHKIKTAFETFEKDSLSASPEDYQKRREELRTRIYSIHGDFDSIAWSWTWSVSYRARVLKLVSEKEFEELQAQADKYVKNLTATSLEFDKAWHSYLPANTSASKPTTGPVMPGIEKSLRDLQSERDEIVRKMAGVFQ